MPDKAWWETLRRTVADELETEGWQWWERHRGTLEDLAEHELRGLARGCCSVSDHETDQEAQNRARRDLLDEMDPATRVAAFRDWQLDTYQDLRDAADRRAALLAALGELPGALLQALGKVLAGVLP